MSSRFQVAISRLALALMCLVVAFPTYWMVMTSLQSGADVFDYPPKLLPLDLTLQSYGDMFTKRPLSQWLMNSLAVSGITSSLTIFFGSTAAYALSRFKFHGSNLVAMAILITQMVPPLVLIIPLFEIFHGAGIDDTLTALIIANLAFNLAVTVWMMKSVFDSIPIEIEEAARVDGASWITIFFRITGPIALPGLLACGIFTFINSWDEFLLARTIITSEENWILPIGLHSLFGTNFTRWELTTATAVIYAIPPLVLFLTVQRYFVAGLSGGAVKG